uniref:Galectin n=1 Tax=Sinocyclocheilus rhinocerous TaxID=307959 RepID=A0A673KDB1_9TELE
TESIKPRPPPATYNPPSIPYVSRISGGLKAGKAIFIQGSVPSGCESFVVNLKCGESEGDDIAFQIKPQFSSDRMVLNSRQHGSWGKEEKLELPLKQASGFDLIIAVNSENYQVEVGRFQHRISLDRVIALSVGGEARPLLPTESIKPRPPPATYNPPVCKPYHNTGIQNALFTMQSIPYVSRISGGLKAGKAIFIQGSVPSGCESFVVNLKCGESEGDDIAFQIKPQFSSDRMVLNSRQHGSWGKEEKLELPLKQASGFDLIIRYLTIVIFNLKVYLNGSEVGRFQHRISLDRVIALSVGGEVSYTYQQILELGCIYLTSKMKIKNKIKP